MSTETLTVKDRQIKKFDKATAQVDKIVVKLSGILQIQTKEQSDNAIMVMKDAKAIEKIIEDKRVELVKPMNDQVKKINDYAKGLTSRISTGIDAGKKAVLAFQKDEEVKAQKAKVAARENELLTLGMEETTESFVYGNIQIVRTYIPSLSDDLWMSMIIDTAKKIQAIKDDAVKKLSRDKDLLDAFGSDEDKEAIEEQIAQASTPVAMPSTAPVISMPTRIKGQTKNWKFKIIDTALIPREYLVPDEVKIRAAIARGERVIAGVEIFQEDSLSLR